jgi:hypothetical protein
MPLSDPSATWRAHNVQSLHGSYSPSTTSTGAAILNSEDASVGNTTGCGNLTDNVHLNEQRAQNSWPAAIGFCVVLPPRANREVVQKLRNAVDQVQGWMRYVTTSAAGQRYN